MSARAGFTLIELVIALVLSTFVLVGIIGVTSQMLRYHMEGEKKTVNTGYELMSLDSMVRELQQATALYCPSFSSSTGCGSRTSRYLSGCFNYTFRTGAAGPADGNAANVQAFCYCVWPAAKTPTGTPWLLHYRNTASGCPYPTATCSNNACGNGSFRVVAQDIRPIGTTPYYFQRADDANGVQLYFQVGASTTTTSILKVDTKQMVNSKIPIQRAFTSTFD